MTWNSQSITLQVAFNHPNADSWVLTGCSNYIVIKQLISYIAIGTCESHLMFIII